ncbi:MAG: C40 family peptidase [Gemmatimonadales bacterium]|nr:C40 family peptidase [Gemmatimonadales bacterium]
MRKSGVRVLLGATLAIASVADLPAQGFEAQAGRFYNSGGWNSYRIGFGTSLARSIAGHLHGTYLDRATSADGAFVGLGVDVSAFRGGHEGPYVVAGFDAGIGSDYSNILRDTWGSWSAGGGWEVFPAEFLAVGGEARFRQMSMGHRDGLELSLGIRLHFGGGQQRPAPPVRTPISPGVPQHSSAKSTPPDSSPRASSTAAPLAESSSSGSPAGSDRTQQNPTPTLGRATASPVTLTDSVLATATEMMGRRYEYGGTGTNGQGFDCSGLIQYAYGQHGVQLPRRSVDQAREGRAVRKRLTSLEPGDLLTFSNRGGRVTHVGMYVGDGRFIHSASRGVQVSQLSDEDPYGRWWYRRWVGVRRVAP